MALKSRNTATSLEPQTWLLDEVARRQQRNPKFSLRAMAKLLGVSPGALSEVISGRRVLTTKMALKFAERLSLSPSEKLALLENLPKSGAKARRAPVAATATVPTQLDVDTFHVIAEWHHHAILSLCRVKTAEARPEWVAERLGISLKDATSAMERLRRLGMLEIDGGSMRQVTPDHDVLPAVPNTAVRKFHAETLRKAEESLHQHSVEERHFAALTLAVDASKLAKAKRVIDKFRWEIDKILESPGQTNDRVYTLMIGLFPIDRGP